MVFFYTYSHACFQKRTKEKKKEEKQKEKKTPAKHNEMFEMVSKLGPFKYKKCQYSIVDIGQVATKMPRQSSLHGTIMKFPELSLKNFSWAFLFITVFMHLEYLSIHKNRQQPKVDKWLITSVDKPVGKVEKQKTPQRES